MTEKPALIQRMEIYSCRAVLDNILETWNGEEWRFACGLAVGNGVLDSVAKEQEYVVIEGHHDHHARGHQPHGDLWALRIQVIEVADGLVYYPFCEGHMDEVPMCG